MLNDERGCDTYQSMGKSWYKGRNWRKKIPQLKEWWSYIAKEAEEKKGVNIRMHLHFSSKFLKRKNRMEARVWK